ncbi:MAG: carbon storage regulator [Planctomycetota bacterium]|nr:carbon storage regulator [Planctomycetota bacterium]
MLVISLKVMNFASIGSDMAVRVVGVRGDTVRIGFHAPRSVRVLRDSLLSAEELEALGSLYGIDMFTLKTNS